MCCPPSDQNRLVRPLLYASAACALVTALASTLAVSPVRAATTELYTLETTCSVKGGQPQPCVVKAMDDEEAGVTTYVHTLGKSVFSIRVSDAPLTMSAMAPGSKDWVRLSSAGARFSTNTICFNDRELCVVNPNYLNSVREDRPDASAGRDLVGVKFGDDGRVIITCWDEGCEGVK
ncbi:hypothetical protein [Cyanobium sp. NIES-981]|uniref:hypothetical protein n=1 Tax=Cyanobium sp. NIES-981 TaxID=1851505 RepID=UPI0007DD6ACD|nr:hypothetical protein [Cyanobium sp. NIES-981]SBO41807.1 conserved exported protein of unknown function [Cyanobium sp. NIES-981]